MMNRLFTCKIKEHNEIIVQLAPLAPLTPLQPPTSTVQFQLKYILVGARVRCTVLSTVNLLENFGAQRANHVYSTAFSSPRN